MRCPAVESMCMHCTTVASVWRYTLQLDNCPAVATVCVHALSRCSVCAHEKIGGVNVFPEKLGMDGDQLKNWRLMFFSLLLAFLLRALVPSPYE